MTRPFLSIIIPAHNEEIRLPLSLGQVFTFLQQQVYPSEVLVIENGSTDRTLRVAEEISHTFPGLQVHHEDQAGKGRAVRRGILEAKGEYRFIADADLSMPVEQINRFLPPASSSDITIASREASGAIRYGEPQYRHLTGRIYNLLIRSLVLPGFQDTQCGFKCFSARAAEDVFRLQTLTGWSFDIEILVIARRKGYRITEIGIPWMYTQGSKVNILLHSGQMFIELLKIRRNLRQGIYDS